MTKAGWIDVSVPLREGLASWPGDTPFHIERVSDMARGDVYTLSKLAMSGHAATHMDAPLHFIRNGATIDTLPIDATVGPARVVALPRVKMIGVDVLRPLRIKAGERIIFKTSNSRKDRVGTFFEDYVAVTPDAAAYLVERRPMTIGIDGPSVGPFHEGIVETHQHLLGAGIWVIEGLDLSKVSPGAYDLVCLPLRVVGADGAPARVVLRRRGR
jgi:arylformamidase